MGMRRVWVIAGAVTVSSALSLSQVQGSSWDPKTGASNTGSIVNTRHNLTQSFLAGVAGGEYNPDITGDNIISLMNASRNEYGEVCVYCHTPHGANSDIQAPLWNHTMSTGSYQPYVTQTLQVGVPGPNSLMCLSCHDGTVAVDSIINMPGSGRYDATNATGVGNDAFLDNWALSGGGPGGGAHMTLQACANSCHSVEGFAPLFEVFVISKDLTNDHPIGVNFPPPNSDEFFHNYTDTVPGKYAYIDNGNSKFDKADIRMYASGSDYKVECSSCHDPHGVPSAGAGSEFIGSFLRVDNAGSALCLTCHNK